MKLIKERYQRRVKFDDLLNFIGRQTPLLNNPEYSRAAFSDGKDKLVPVKTFKTKSRKEGTRRQTVGQFPSCTEGYTLDTCPHFESLDTFDSGRMNVLREHWLCSKCFRPTNQNHFSKICRSKPQCAVCGERHQTPLHGAITAAALKRQSIKSRTSLLSVVQVYLSHAHCPQNCILVYAMLDP